MEKNTVFIVRQENKLRKTRLKVCYNMGYNMGYNERGEQIKLGWVLLTFLGSGV
jgi:hypothetical protein